MNTHKIAKSVLINFSRRFRWLTGQCNTSNETPFEVSLLAVKKAEYAALARVCIESFLYYHPRSYVTVFCDETTFASLRRNLFLVSRFKPGRVRIAKVDTLHEWQYLKVSLISQLEGPNSLFMDCDLRWNGPIPQLIEKKVLFFVQEKKYFQYSGVKEVVSQFDKRFLNEPMKNTSVFSWSGKSRTDEETALLDQIGVRLKNIINEVSGPMRDSMLRIYEQLQLSLFVDHTGFAYTFLKISDSPFDGSICESSYFGASNGRFAIWGNTSRKSFFQRGCKSG